MLALALLVGRLMLGPVEVDFLRPTMQRALAEQLDGFTVDFADAAARDAYLPHPDHQLVGKMVVAALDGGLEGLAVVDWEV